VWTQQAYVKASNTNMGNPFGSGDLFGVAVALNGDTLVVGASGELSSATGIDGNQLDNGGGNSGAVYIFARTNNRWSQVAYVKASPPSVSSTLARQFGRWLAFDGTTLAVGSGDETCATGFNPSPGLNNCPGSNAVYLFSRTATSWAQRAFVKASNAEANDSFGTAVGTLGLAIAGSTLAVGAPNEDSCATGINGDQTNNSCGDPPPIIICPVCPPAVPSIGGSGAVYVYVLE
jgi:hypothetical protein